MPARTATLKCRGDNNPLTRVNGQKFVRPQQRAGCTLQRQAEGLAAGGALDPTRVLAVGDGFVEYRVDVRLMEVVVYHRDQKICVVDLKHVKITLDNT